MFRRHYLSKIFINKNFNFNEICSGLLILIKAELFFIYLLSSDLTFKLILYIEYIFF